MKPAQFNQLVDRAFNGTAQQQYDRATGTARPILPQFATPTPVESVPGRTAIPSLTLDALSDKQTAQTITALTKVMVYVAQERSRHDPDNLGQVTRGTIGRLQQQLGDWNLQVLIGTDPKRLMSREYSNVDQSEYAHALNMLEQSLPKDCSPDSIRLNAPSVAAIAAVRKFSGGTHGRSNVEQALENDILDTETGLTHRLQLDDASRSKLMTALDGLDSMERHWLYSKHGREYASAYSDKLPPATARPTDAEWFGETGTDPDWAAKAASSLLQGPKPLVQDAPANALRGWGS